jgi:hypothetical protein
VDLTQLMRESQLSGNSESVEDDGLLATGEPISDDAAVPEEADEESSEGSGEIAGRDLGGETADQLQAAYRLAEARMLEKTAESDRYRRMLDQLGQGTRMLLQQADEEAFVRDMRDAYQKDPVEATNRMIRRAQEEAWNAVESRIGEAIQQQQQFGRLMDTFFDDPRNTGLKTHRSEIEFLIREKGLFPHEAADLVRNIRGKQDQTVKQRSAAANDVRKRSTVETSGESDQTVDRDKEFSRAMKRAKNLDQMFAELRKIKY